MPEPLLASSSPLEDSDLVDEAFDLIVVGGGIIGSGIARDAALRGARVALVEMNDLAWGTTARSTRLVHGGLRYLEHYDFGLVREALHERKTLIRIAPHLVRPLPLLLPKIRGRGRPRWMLRVGLFLYDTLARRNIGRPHRWWSRDRVLERVPALDRPDLVGAFEFFDAQVAYPERLVIENALDVVRHGGVVLNHVEALGLDPAPEPRNTSRDTSPDEGPSHTLRVRDTLTKVESALHTRLVVNTGGPWVTQVDSRLGSGSPALTRRTKGVHLLTDPITDHAMLIQCADGERIIFVIPWEGYSLIGTTDTDYGGANETVHAEPEDVRYLLDEVNLNLDVSLGPEDVHMTYAGLRPLIHQEGGTTGAVSRRHLIVDHDREGAPAGLVTVVGGKITSFRAIAAHVVDHVMQRVLPAREASSSPTADVAMPGGTEIDETSVRRRLGAALPHMTDDDVDRVLDLYGARAMRLVEIGARPGQRIGHIHPSSRLTWEEARFAVEDEFARTLEDVLLRRTMAGWARDAGLGVAPALAEGLGRWFGWSDQRVADELERYRATVHRNREGVEALVGKYTPKHADPRIGKHNVRKEKRRKR